MKYLKMIFLLIFSVLFLASCSNLEEHAKRSFFAMDTYMTITAYGENAETAVMEASKKISGLEALWSVTDENSEIYKINHSGGISTEVSPETADLLKLMLEISEATDGALDCTIYPVLTEWGFTTGEYSIPTEERLSELLPLTGWEKISLNGQTVTIPENMQLDLGAAGKGRAGMLAAEILRENGVSSALLDLGGNIQTVGTKPDGSDWRLGIRSPFDDGTLAVIEVSDCAAVTSGGYERYFVGEDGNTYWHILDPKTGKPADSGLVSATIIGKDGAVCDALSTAVFVMGSEKAGELWRQQKDFDMILVTGEGEIFITEGIETSFSLSPSYSEMPVSVIR